MQREIVRVPIKALTHSCAHPHDATVRKFAGSDMPLTFFRAGETAKGSLANKRPLITNKD